MSSALAISLLFVDTIFQLFNGKNILGFQTIDSQNRISSFFGKMILGSYVLKILPMFLVSIFYLIKVKFMTDKSPLEVAKKIRNNIVQGDSFDGKIKGVVFVKPKLETITPTT